jgi:tetratricopeptide (TPR) repeat protein
MRVFPLLLWFVAAGAFAGDEPAPAAERAYAPKAKKADAYELEDKADEDLRRQYATWTDADGQALDHARLALTFGRYDVARDVALPLAEKAPTRADVQTVAGLAWMGTYYEKYGLSEGAFARLQGLLVDPSAPGLSKEEIGPALARGFVLTPGSSVRGGPGGATPEPLLRAQAALDAAFALDPSDGTALLHAFVAEVERSRWEPRPAQLTARRQLVEARIGSWPTELVALAWVDLGVDAYVARNDPAAAVAAFEKAQQLGSPLAAYDRALVLAFDPAMSARKAEGLAALKAMSADPAMGADRVAASAGRLPTPTGWPFGAPPVEWATSSRDMAEIVAVIDGADPAGAVRTELGEVDEVVLANGLRAIVKQGYGAWVEVPVAHVEAPQPDVQAVAGVAQIETEVMITRQTAENVQIASAPRRKETRGGKAAAEPVAPAEAPAPMGTSGYYPDSGLYAVPRVGPRARTAPVLDVPRHTLSVRVEQVCGENPADTCPMWMEVRVAE